MIWFTADEHYGHANIIHFCNRPFPNVWEMDKAIIEEHNRVVGDEDTVVHVGDFTLRDPGFARRILESLKGHHVFVKGSHDKWLPDGPYLLEDRVEGQTIVACHYAMLIWPKSHYGSWQVYGHSHGHLRPEGKQWDVGVDNNGFKPVSFPQLKEIMATLPDNRNLLGKLRGVR